MLGRWKPPQLRSLTHAHPVQHRTHPSGPTTTLVPSHGKVLHPHQPLFKTLFFSPCETKFQRWHHQLEGVQKRNKRNKRREREREVCNESESFRFAKPVSGIQSWCVVYKKKAKRIEVFRMSMPSRIRRVVWKARDKKGRKIMRERKRDSERDFSQRLRTYVNVWK